MIEELTPPYRMVLHDELDSTNDEARRMAKDGATSGLWVVASQQTNGRGRRGREWVSEKGNFFGSLYLRLENSPSEWSQLSFVAALAVREVLEELSAGKGEVSLKWPNDVLYNGHKISGILLESGISTNAGKNIGEVILGIGVNLAHAPKNTNYSSTSFYTESGFIILPRNFLPLLSKCFDKYLQIWLKDGFELIRKAWMINASGLNKLARVNLVDKSFEGVFLGLASDGGARIKMDNAAEIHVLAGDIFPL